MEKDDAAIYPIPMGGGKSTQEPEMDYLSHIITTLNETYGIDLKERDKVHVQQIITDVETDEGVQAVLTGNNTMTSKRHKVHQVIDARILDQVHTSIDLYKKLTDPQVNEAFKRRLFDRLMRQFSTGTMG